MNLKDIKLASYALVNEKPKSPHQIKFKTWEKRPNGELIPKEPDTSELNLMFINHLYMPDKHFDFKGVSAYLDFHFENRTQPEVSDAKYLSALEAHLWYHSKEGNTEGKKYQDVWIRKWIDSKRSDPSPQKSVIQFDPSIISLIHQKLSPFFSESDHAKLFLLLEGKTIGQKLYFQDYGRRLVYLFRQLHAGGKLSGNKKELRDWICDNFTYQNRGKQLQPFDQSNVYNDLTKKEEEVKPAHPINLSGTI